MSDKTCIVMKCENSSVKTPDKLFIPVPTQLRKRKKWLLLARTDPKTIIYNSNVYMCEDHFNIQKDMPNYMMYKMGFTQKIILTDGALPSKFDCNEDHKKHVHPGTSQACLKKKRLDLIKDCEEEISLQTGKKNQPGIQLDNNSQDRRPYRWCAVPGCSNTSVTTPNKIFVSVPQKMEMRKKWFEMAGRDSSEISGNTVIFFCEDHFDLPNDMVNYMRYRVMGSVKQIMMRPGCLPSKFDCQKGLESIPNNPNPKNKKRLATVQESFEDNVEADDGSRESNNIVFPNPMTRCPMIQIPLSTNQFAPPVQSDTDSDTDYGTELFLPPPVQSDTHSDTDYGTEIFLQESVVPTENVLNETPVEEHEIKIEIAEEVANNVSMYCEDQHVQSLEQASKHKGELTLFGGFQCSVCDGEIVGFRYTCVQCSDFDLCGACENNRMHQQHYVLRVPALNPYPDVQFVLATIRRHLMKDLDPITELDPDPGDGVKCEMKTDSEDEMSVTIENDGFDNVETSDLFEHDQVTPVNTHSFGPYFASNDTCTGKYPMLGTCDDPRNITESPNERAIQLEVVPDIYHHQQQTQQRNIHSTQTRPSNAERHRRYREKKKAEKMNACPTFSQSSDDQPQQDATQHDDGQINKRQPLSNAERQRKYRQLLRVRQQGQQMGDINAINVLSNTRRTSSIDQRKNVDEAEQARKRHLNKQRQSRFRARQRLKWHSTSSHQAQAESVKCEMKTDSEDEMSVTIENDGFDNVETSDLFEHDQVTNIPSVRPVAVIRVNGEHDSTLMQLDGSDAMKVTSDSTDEFKAPKRKIHITMSELPDFVKEKTRGVVSVSSHSIVGNASRDVSSRGSHSTGTINIMKLPRPPSIVIGQGSDQTQTLPPNDDRSNSATEDIR